MRIIKCTFENGYVGGTIEEVYILGNVSDNEVDHCLYMNFDEFCEDYAYLAQGYPWEVEEGGYYDTEEEAEEDRQSYYDGCEWGWEEITLDELKEWCEEMYGDYESYYEPIIAAQLELETKEEK